MIRMSCTLQCADRCQPATSASGLLRWRAHVRFLSSLTTNHCIALHSNPRFKTGIKASVFPTQSGRRLAVRKSQTNMPIAYEIATSFNMLHQSPRLRAVCYPMRQNRTNPMRCPTVPSRLRDIILIYLATPNLQDMQLNNRTIHCRRSFKGSSKFLEIS